MDTKTNFCSILKAKGLKVTKHRNSVLEVIEAENQPITAEDIYIELKNKGISINLSSVYRILDTLVENSLINKYVIGENNKTSYEINSLKHKHHLICTRCNRVFPLDLYIVVSLYSSSGFNKMLGKSLLFAALGNPCVSKHNPSLLL